MISVFKMTSHAILKQALICTFAITGISKEVIYLYFLKYISVANKLLICNYIIHYQLYNNYSKTNRKRCVDIRWRNSCLDTQMGLWGLLV